tara:strand:- start:49 stop:639 length:591 start_codon:yes stop_codon:yes gene_type:complete
MLNTKPRRTITDIEREAIYEVWKGKCAYCEKKIKDDYNIDHILPHSLGGSCDLSNLCLSCKSCNMKKRNVRLPIFYEGILIGIATKKECKIKEKIKEKIKDKCNVKHNKEEPFIPRTLEVKHYYCSVKNRWLVSTGEAVAAKNMKGITEHGRKWIVQRRIRGELMKWRCDSLSAAIKKRDEVFNTKYEDLLEGKNE